MARSNATRQPGTLANVTVYGAGISGLTAAHELAERGFSVRVVEAARERDARGRPALALGGIARTQYGRAPRPRYRWRDPTTLDRERRTAGDEDRCEADEDVAFRVCVEFPSRARELTEEAMAAIEFGLEALDEPAVHRFRVTGFADDLGAGDYEEGDARNSTLARHRAQAVRSFLLDACGVEDDQVVVDVAPLDDGVELAWQRAARRALAELNGAPPPPDEASSHQRWVVVELDEVVLPGEHGFRFFPSYYRHVFDTLRRIPLLDARGDETGRTVFDRVVSSERQGVAELGLDNPIVTPRTPPESDLTLSRSFAQLVEKGYSWRDVHQFLLRVLRYMSTSSERRAAECEDLSWWDFLRGWDPSAGVARYRYSEAFERDVKFSAKVLAAFNAEWGDARTNGSTYVQLLLNSLVHRDKINGCLDGPTTDAWFVPWRRHLERLGVEFVAGRVETIQLDERGRVRPIVRYDDEDRARPDDDADYYVLATDVIAAEALTRALPQVGVPGQLAGFSTTLRAADPSGRGAARPRDPYTESGVEPWDRLQTLSGVQYFFTTDLKLVHGHMYFGSAEWALSSINHHQFWARRPFLQRDGYSSLLSVDVGAFDRPSTHPPLAGRTAWQCSRRELAEEVWRQICADLGERYARGGDEASPDEAGTGTRARRLQFPQPTWYHVDSFLEYGERDGVERPLRNHAPFLIPIVGDWKHRPGAEPWSPSHTKAGSALRPLDSEALWQAPHGGAWVHWDQLLFVGTYKRTFTRMTTMESANESARHVVNAIIDHFLLSDVARRRREARLGADPESLARARTRRAAPAPEVDANTRLWRPAAPDETGYDLPYRSTLLGDYCQIWDMERYELPEFESIRAEDARLFARGLPHPWDLAGVELLASVGSLMFTPTMGASPDAGELLAAARRLQRLIETELEKLGRAGRRAT
ncbi:MAG: NAD(P)-binding protein [Myxococcales bacterium]|nr:NAD(P)-binding protein [Myxococcales bacterium]